MIGNQIRLLLVDDHGLFRSGMRKLFSLYADLTVVGEASSGEEALALIPSCSPDVVLMDIDMPGQGGIAATQAIQERWPECSVVILTGLRTFLEPSMRAGARGYVLKTADEEEMITAVRTVYAGGAHLQTEIQAAVVELLQRDRAAILSEREVAMVRLIADGTSNHDIGLTLGLSESSVKQQISVILKKLSARDRAHAVAIAMKHGLM